LSFSFGTWKLNFVVEPSGALPGIDGDVGGRRAGHHDDETEPQNSAENRTAD
jgi:hypothetical protein